jgi:hypothetical protein
MKHHIPMGAFLATFLAVALALSPAEVRAEGDRSLVLCYPGGNVKSRDAEPSAKSMVELVEKLGGFKAGTFSSRFTSKVDQCDTWMAENPPFAIVSLGWWLGHRDAGWVPLVQPRIKGSTDEVFRVLVRKGTYASLDDLRGKTITGTPLVELDFLLKVVLGGRYKASDFQLDPSRLALRALRNLNDREVDAVVVTSQQFQSLGALPFAESLEPVFTSAPIPLMGVVASEKTTTADERRRFQKALTGFCAHKDGKQFCELFGIDAFVPANASTYDAMKTLWK